MLKSSAKRQAVLAVNTRSRRGGEWFSEAKQELENGGIVFVEAVASSSLAGLISVVERAAANSIPTIVVGGGDGTFGSVAHCFLYGESTLGVLPFGTGNAFARDLGIQADIRTATRVILDGIAAKVDVGRIGQRHFLNVATVGLTTLIALELTPQAKQRFGRLVYAVALAKALRRVKPFEVTIKTPTVTEHYRTLQVVIGAGRFHAGPFPVAPDAAINDGRLNLYVLTECTRMALFRYATHLPGGRHVHLKEVCETAVSEGSLEAVPTQRITVDGEVAMQTPADFRVLPRSLRVFVPESFDRVSRKIIAERGHSVEIGAKRADEATS